MEMDGEDVVPPENETPEAIKESANFVTIFLAQYGWFIVFGIIALIFLKNKFEPSLQKLKKKREDNYYAQHYDATTTQARHESMMAARLRMQERYDEDARIAEEERKKKEEQKRKEKIEDWDRHVEGKGYRSKIYKSEQDVPSTSSSTNKDKKPKQQLRQNDYNPLMGGYSAGGYRPSRRSGFGGGG
ncbi:selenoprotein S-like isoform X1 [Ptychodera flava]|uniref:selenoprotein S-like isoform X1 n=1 Tax=Ptychodera flava TaxID=63121 RepID=UPI003969F7B8